MVVARFGPASWFIIEGVPPLPSVRVSSGRLRGRSALLLIGLLSVLLASSHCSPAAAASSARAGLVPGFGNRGTLFFPQSRSWEPGTEAVAASAGGEIVAALPAERIGRQRLVRIRSDGSLEPGSAVVERPGARAVAVDSRDRVVVSIGLEQSLVVARFLPGGKPDRAFGEDGVASVAIPGYVGRMDGDQATVLSVDRLDRVIVGRLKAARTSFRRGTGFLAARLRADGRLDPSFGTGGLLTAKVEHSTPFSLVGFHVDPSTQQLTLLATVFGDAEGPFQRKRFELVRILRDGSFDPAFGNGGIVRVTVGRLGTRAAAMAIDRRGRIVLGGTNGRGLGFARLLPDGHLDPAFGRRGRFIVPVPFAAASARLGDLAIDEHGRILVAANARLRAFPLRSLIGFRLGPRGRSLDLSFGREGICAASFEGWSAAATAILPQRRGTAILSGLASRPMPGSPTTGRLRGLAMARCSGERG